MTLRRPLMLVILSIFTLVIGCSSDDDPADPGAPDDPSIKTVIVTPESVEFGAIGEDIQFEAAAFDGSGAVVDTTFTWQSNMPSVVVIGSDGVATAASIGTAEIYGTAGGVADTAMVAVNIVDGPLVQWASAVSGNWDVGANWNTGSVPGSGDIALINASGTYTVSIASDVTVLGLVLGSDSGIQSLNTGANTLTFNNGGLQGGAELVINGTVEVLNDLVWSSGSLTGDGNLKIMGSAEFDVLGNPLELDVDLANRGELRVWPGASLRIHRELNNETTALIELQDDAIMTVMSGGDFTNLGTIAKSEGLNEASLFTTAGNFTSTGTIDVETGSLTISSGTLQGFIEIADGARFRQTGNTDFPSLFVKGEGDFEVNGRATFGSFENQSLKIEHLILDSGSIPAISGVALLRVDQTFVWRRGVIGDLNGFTTQFGSSTKFETNGTKVLSSTPWEMIGTVSGNNFVNLSLANGAGITINRQGKWLQMGAGTIEQGPGGSIGIDVKGFFEKTDEGAFVVETAFNCSGTMDLTGTAIAVIGDFTLTETGLITGGGTNPVYENVNLVVVNATNATMAGTVRPGLDDLPARMTINGNVELSSSFRLELDMPINGEFVTESLNFSRGGQVLNGTLIVKVAAPVVPNFDYRVVSMTQGLGMFTDVIGDEQFDSVVQDESGVVLRQ